MGNGVRDIERELRAISACNQTLLRARDEQSLLDNICRIVVEEAGHKMAWVGIAEHDEARSVRVAASAGAVGDYLTDIDISWGDAPNGLGPTGTAIRSATTVYTDSFATDPSVAPWRERALSNGLACSVALPLKLDDGVVLGALMIYSATENAFHEQERELLSELAGDMAFGINVLRARAEQARLDETLKESETKFRVAFQTSPDAMTITCMDDSCYLDVNDAFVHLTGFTREEALTSTSTDLRLWAHPEDRALVAEALAAGDGVDGMVVRYRHKDGGEIVGEFSARLITLNDRRCVLSVVRDVTEQMKSRQELAESREKLRASEELFRTLYRTSPDAIILSRLSDGVFIDVSEGTEWVFGYSREELLGQSSLEMHMWQSADDRAALVGELHAHGVARMFEAGMLTKDGHKIVAQISARMLEIDGEQRMLSIMRDATAERLAEHELYASRERLRATIEHAQVGIVQVDLKGHFIEANDCFEEMLGYSAAELRELTFADITHPDDRGRDVTALESMARGVKTEYHAEKRYIAKDGRVVWVDVAVAVARDRDGTPDYLVTVVKDVSERKAAEDALHNTTRAMRALSRVNESLIRATSEAGLLGNVCDIIADQGYPLVWVGYSRDDPSKPVLPVHAAGGSHGILDAAGEEGFAWADEARGHGPIGKAIRDRRVTVIRRGPAPGRVQAAGADGVQHYEFKVALVLPLALSDSTPFGAVCIYSRDVDAFGEEEVALLTEMSNDLSFGIETLRARIRQGQAERDLVLSNMRLQEVLREITETMGKIVETRDPYTQGHQQRVATIAGQIAQEMGLSADDIEMIESAALVHDVGKLSVPAEILNKPGKLSEPEFSIIKGHSQTGYEILKHIDFEWPVAEIVLQHHERMDGSGYPQALSGDEILLPARVLAVADVVEAIASHRPYRPALGLEIAISELETHPQQFDHDVVSACLRLYQDERLEL